MPRIKRITHRCKDGTQYLLNRGECEICFPKDDRRGVDNLSSPLGLRRREADIKFEDHRPKCGRCQTQEEKLDKFGLCPGCDHATRGGKRGTVR